MSTGRRSTHCVTCADEGVAMTVVEVDERSGLARCVSGDRAGATGETALVETALVEPVRTGELLLVHAGTAIARVPA